MRRLTVVYNGDYGPTPAALMEPKVRGSRLRAYDPFSGSEFWLPTDSVLHVADTQEGIVVPYVQVASYGEVYEVLGGKKAARVAANREKSRLFAGAPSGFIPRHRRKAIRRTPLPPPPIPKPEPIYADMFTDDLSGFSRVASYIRAHRSKPVSPQSILCCGLYALATVNVGTDIADWRAFALTPWIRKGKWPPPDVLAENIPAITKREQFIGRAEKFHHERWPEQMARYLDPSRRWTLKDQALRRRMAIYDGLPYGLGLTKASFMLMLLGQNLMCFDTHMMAWLCFQVGRAEAVRKRMAEYWVRQFSTGREELPWGHGFTPEPVQAYEEFEENALVAGKCYYDPSDPVGRVRAHWMIWGHLRRNVPAEHLGFVLMLGEKLAGWELGPPREYLKKAKRMKVDPWEATMQRRLPLQVVG